MVECYIITRPSDFWIGFAVVRLLSLELTCLGCLLHLNIYSFEGSLSL